MENGLEEGQDGNQENQLKSYCSNTDDRHMVWGHGNQARKSTQLPEIFRKYNQHTSVKN